MGGCAASGSPPTRCRCEERGGKQGSGEHSGADDIGIDLTDGRKEGPSPEGQCNGTSTGDLGTKIAEVGPLRLPSVFLDAPASPASPSAATASPSPFPRAFSAGRRTGTGTSPFLDLDILGGNVRARTECAAYASEEFISEGQEDSPSSPSQDVFSPYSWRSALSPTQTGTEHLDLRVPHGMLSEPMGRTMKPKMARASSTSALTDPLALKIITRSSKRRIKQRVNITNTMGDTPSMSLQLIINNKGRLEDYYNCSEVLGKGSFGVVRRAHLASCGSGAGRAVKSISKERMKDKIGALKHEIEIMKMVDHPHVVRIFEIFEDSVDLHLVIELCMGGHLESYVNKLGRLRESSASAAMQQLLQAVVYLHQNLICHRDLKAENCLLAAAEPLERNSLKVADFGLSCIFKPGLLMTSCVGTPSHMAPEVKAKKYDQACDSWSCGIIMYFMISGLVPYDKNAEEGKKYIISFGQRHWAEASSECVALATKLLVKSAKQRISPKDALSHPWFAKTVPKMPMIPMSMEQCENLRKYRTYNKLKRAALSLTASLVSEADLFDHSRLFVSMDLNGDGHLSASELADGLAASSSQASSAGAAADTNPLKATGQGSSPKAAARRLSVKAGTPPPAATPTAAEIAAMMPDMARPEAEFVPFTYTEFVAATLNRQHFFTEKIIKAAFSSLDRNSDGGIDVNEVAEGRLLGALTEHQISQMLAEMDANGDAVIDLAEFTAMILS